MDHYTSSSKDSDAINAYDNTLREYCSKSKTPQPTGKFQSTSSEHSNLRSTMDSGYDGTIDHDENSNSPQSVQELERKSGRYTDRRSSFSLEANDDDRWTRATPEKCLLSEFAKISLNKSAPSTMFDEARSDFGAVSSDRPKSADTPRSIGRYVWPDENLTAPSYTYSGKGSSIEMDDLHELDRSRFQSTVVSAPQRRTSGGQFSFCNSEPPNLKYTLGQSGIGCGRNGTTYQSNFEPTYRRCAASSESDAQEIDATRAHSERMMSALGLNRRNPPLIGMPTPKFTANPFEQLLSGLQNKTTHLGSQSATSSPRTMTGGGPQSFEEQIQWNNFLELHKSMLQQHQQAYQHQKQQASNGSYNLGSSGTQPNASFDMEQLNKKLYFPDQFNSNNPFSSINTNSGNGNTSFRRDEIFGRSLANDVNNLPVHPVLATSNKLPKVTENLDQIKRQFCENFALSHKSKAKVDGTIGFVQLCWKGLRECWIPTELTANQISVKVFLGGLSWDIREDELSMTFAKFGLHTIEWPNKNSTERAHGKGYAYVIFETHQSVVTLLQNCEARPSRNNSKLPEFHMLIHNRQKTMQVIPWFICENEYTNPDLSTNSATHQFHTAFVGALHGQMTAPMLGRVFNEKFNNSVVAAYLDTDRHKYPIGSGRVVLSNMAAFKAAIEAMMIQVETPLFNKRIQIDPFLEEKHCDVCRKAPGDYFCRSFSCFQYYCYNCFFDIHARISLEEKGESLAMHIPVRRQGNKRSENDSSLNLATCTSALNLLHTSP